jgi:hypothetical protein
MTRLAVALLLAACNGTAGTKVSVHNLRAVPTTVYVSFGADSKVTSQDWPFCEGNGLLTCKFPLPARTPKALPSPAYLNATLSFDQPVGCGVTKAEVNVNNPAWYDTLDVSLVDGYSDKVQILWTPTKGAGVLLGPPLGQTGNEKVYGLFPLGCDICVERQNPPCGIAKGKQGCKTGTQYDPDVPCQWQGPIKGGGGGDVMVALQP